VELACEFLGLGQDQAISGHFRRHHNRFFPALSRVHRATFLRQAANLLKMKDQVWQHLLSRISYDSTLALVDSFPLPVCQFARACRCRRFKGEAAFGKDTLIKQTFYGLRVHVRLRWPGVITRFGVAPANVSETARVPSLAEGTTGLLLGDRNYWSPALTEELGESHIELQALFRIASSDP